MTVVSYKIYYAAVAAVALLLALSPQVRAGGEYCGGVPEAGFDRPPNVAHSGHYDNPTYGYSVEIPMLLAGYTAASAPPSGFGILLSGSPRAYLHVAAIYDMYFSITDEHVHRSDLVGMRLHDTVIEDHAERYVLEGHEGGRYRTQVRCGTDPQVYLHEDVIVFVNREIYRLDLQTIPQRYDTDVKVLEAMLHSWRWLKISPSSR